MADFKSAYHSFLNPVTCGMDDPRYIPAQEKQKKQHIGFC